MKRYSMIFLLIGLFLAPGFIAAVFYTHPQLLQQYFPTQTNKGELLAPPLKSIDLGENKKWHLVLWQPLGCNVSCKSETDRLARIRLALGRHLYDVDQWLLLGANAQALDPVYEQTLESQAIYLKKLSSTSDVNRLLEKDLGSESRIYLANPDHYFVLGYPVDAKAESIFHDLKKLIS
ncbi:MAG: hypothetical protein H2069_08925 [Legionella sp.]|nr:hypothetical protein [Legionella sp.]